MLCKREHNQEHQPTVCVSNIRVVSFFHCRANNIRLPDSLPFVLGEEEPVVKKQKIRLKPVALPKHPERAMSLSHGKQNDAVVEYLNQYLLFVHWTAKPAIIELDFTNLSEPYIMRTVGSTRTRWNIMKKALTCGCLVQEEGDP